MLSTADALLSSTHLGPAVNGLEWSAYWLCFVNDRCLIYRHECVIGDFSAENAALALDFLRLKQSERTGERLAIAAPRRVHEERSQGASRSSPAKGRSGH